MKIKLLNLNYKNDENFYRLFLDGKLNDNNTYISNRVVNVNSIPSFFIYLPTEKLRQEYFIDSVKIIANSYINNSADIFESELFWHSLLCLYKRDYILTNYPQVKESYNEFKKIVIKNFNWENYIYKMVMSAKYVTQHTNEIKKQDYYYKLILNNFDLFNYILKYTIFRNGSFLIKILDIIDQENLSLILKSSIDKDRTNNKDKRVGRQIIYEFNKSYPILLSPMLETNELKKYFMKFLSYYK